MKYLKYLVIFSFLIFVIASCKKENVEVNPGSEYLTGVWINPVYTDSTIIFEKTSALPDGAYGLSLQSSGMLIERKNIGWCGTPPISYGDYEGNWSEKDSVIQINVGYWGGEVKLEWKVISVNPNSLKVRQLSIEYEGQ